MNGEKKHVIIIALIFCVVVGLPLRLVFLEVIPNQAKLKEEVEFVRSLGWEPEGSVVTYSTRFTEENTEIWRNLCAWIKYESQPWNNTRGLIWYTQAGQYYFEESE